MNLNILTVFQQAVLAILILLGNVVFVSIFVVIIRCHFFQREINSLLESSKAVRKTRNKVDEEEVKCSTEPASDPGLSQRHAAGFREDAISRPADKTIQPTQYDDANVRLRRESAVRTSASDDCRRSHHQTGLGFFPAPWQTPGVRKAFHWLSRRMSKHPHAKNHRYFSFVPTLDFKVGFP